VINRVGDDVGPLARAILGSFERGSKGAASSAQTFGGLRFAKVL